METMSGKVVLVTGGAQGIGKGLARACLREGARVVITNLDTEVAARTVAELSQLGEIRAARCDATERSAVDALVDDIWAREGALDLVFSNAGAGAMCPVLEMPMSEVHDQFALNVDACLHLAQSVVPRWTAANRAGHIMFTGSENSLVLPAGTADLAMGVYGATKHALLILAEWMRYELRETSVTVSMLLPGPVLTERLAATFQALEDNPDDPGLRSVFSREAEQTLRERFITPDQCAEMALKGLKQGLFFIPTQAYIKDDVDARYREVSDAFRAMGLA